MLPAILTINSFPSRKVYADVYEGITAEGFRGPFLSGDYEFSHKPKPPKPPEAAFIEKQKFPYLMIAQERYNSRHDEEALRGKLTGRCSLFLVEKATFDDLDTIRNRRMWNIIKRTSIRMVRAHLPNDFKMREDELLADVYGADKLSQILNGQLAQPAP